MNKLTTILAGISIIYSTTTGCQTELLEAETSIEVTKEKSIPRLKCGSGCYATDANGKVECFYRKIIDGRSWCVSKEYKEELEKRIK